MKAELINLGRNAIRPPFYSRLNTMKNETPQKSVVLNSFSRAYVVRINRNTRVTIPSNLEETGNIGPKARHSIVCVCETRSDLPRFSARLVKRGRCSVSRSSLCDTRNGSLAGLTNDGLLRTVRSPFRQRSPNESIKTTRLVRRKLARACVNVSTT